MERTGCSFKTRTPDNKKYSRQISNKTNVPANGSKQSENTGSTHVTPRFQKMKKDGTRGHRDKLTTQKTSH